MSFPKPSDYGAEGAVDVGVFLAGAAAGGLVDAALNSFGFASPLVVAGLAGGGALSLKKLLWDSWRTPKKASQSDVRTISWKDDYDAMRAEAALIETLGHPETAAKLRQLIAMGQKERLDPAVVRRTFEDYRSRDDNP